MEITVKLDLRKSGKTENGFPIIIYVSKNYKNRKWRTGHYAKSVEWNEKLAVPKSKHPDYYALSNYLSGLKLRISEVLMHTNNKHLAFDEIKDLIFKKKSKYFFDSAMALFPQGYKGTDWSAVKAFNRFAPNLLFDEIDRNRALKFRDYLLGKGNRPSGVDSYIRSLRAVWNRISDQPNPFRSITVEIPEKINTVASTMDLKALVLADLGKPKRIGGYANYRNYFLLMFYLGGIDPEVLAKLRYDRHVVNGRINFNRNKGRSKTFCSNLIPIQARTILEQYDCAPYFVPIFRANSYEDFRSNFGERMKLLSKKLGLSVALKPKSARYTFIDRAQQFLVDERVTAQIVGHKRRTTTSIYTNDFPLLTQDKYHKKIIEL